LLALQAMHCLPSTDLWADMRRDTVISSKLVFMNDSRLVLVLVGLLDKEEE
jgi:hypothetical protein